MISAGRLRFTATIKRSSVLGDLGLRNKAFATTVGTFRCDMQDAGGGEIMYAGGISESRNWTLSARWQALEDEGLLASDRLEIDGKILNIISISNEFNRDRLGTIQCSEVI
jgi:hypothetical protein